MPTLGEQMRERGPPGARADDDGLHERLTKSIATGTPSRSKLLAELVLDPVAVVAGDQAGVVDEEAEARRAHGRLGAVEEVQPLPVSRRGLADLPQLAEEAIQLARRDRVPCASRTAPRRGRGACPLRGAVFAEAATIGGRWRRRGSSRSRTSSIPTSAMSHFERTTSVDDIDLRAMSAIARSCSTTPSLASTRTSTTSARSAA